MSPHSCPTIFPKSGPSPSKTSSSRVSRAFLDQVAVENSNIRELENTSESVRSQFSQQYRELSQKTLHIKVNDKIQVVFNVNDRIFATEQKVDDEDCEPKEDWSRCNCCGDNDVKKLRNCFFCGELNCPRCLYKTRPYPGNENRTKRGELCLTCNRKFLYRDAMYELMGMLEMKDTAKKNLMSQLGVQEFNYDGVVSQLSKAKMQRREG